MGAREEVARILDRLHPADTVEVLQNLPPAEQKAFLDILIGHPSSASVVAELPGSMLTDLLAGASDEWIASLVSRQPPDEAADLLGLLPPERSDAALKLLDDRTGANLDRLMTYGRKTAGGMMTTHFLALRGSTLVSQAIDRIRSEPDAEMVFYLYVVDDINRLEGVVSLRQLVLARPDLDLQSIMNSRVTRVRVDQPRAEVAETIARYNLLAVPVVEEGNVLAGIITVDDAIDAMTDETTREMYRMAGLNTEDRLTSRPLQSFTRRLPWMILNLGTAIIASWVVWLFEESIAQAVALATFMPIVAGIGGNGATQTLTVMIRGIALGEVSFSSARQAIFRQIAVGTLLGLVTGGVMALVAFLWKGNPYLGLIIALAMIANLLLAGTAGAVVPLVLKRLGLDPALGSAVITTAFTDSFGFLVFLGLGTVFLDYIT
jgi:magnesium transporter